MRNNKGLSDIVATLIIILLVIVAAGIIWVVVRNVVQSGAESVELGQKCFEVNLEYFGVEVEDPAVDNTTYSVTLKRLAGGDEIAGVKVTLFNGTENYGPVDFGSMNELVTKTESVSAGILNANRIEYTPFFTDSAGEEVFCQTRERIFG